MGSREKIYKKALELFIEHGYDNTPMSHIAEAVDLSKAGLYHYFASKKHLLFLIHEHYLEKNLIPLIQTAEKIPDPEERLHYIMQAYTKLIPQMPLLENSTMNSEGYNPSICRRSSESG